MNTRHFLIAATAALLAACNPVSQTRYCNGQINKALDELRLEDGSYDFTMMPRNIYSGNGYSAPDGPGWNCRKALAAEWCSGFWPGILWMDYMETGSEKVLGAARGYTESLEFLAYSPAYDHDLGFLVMNSFGKGYEATGDEAYKRAILAAADSLATLYNPAVGTILSWPREVADGLGPHNTIMDNIINLELLFWAAGNGGNEDLYKVAVSHARKTMENQFRPDGSCYHVALYDTADGHFIKGLTHQGYSDNSMWARGQAWAIYGYTMVYRFTKAPEFLEFAQKVTDIYLKRLPERADGCIPRWDFDDPSPEAPYDASAACITASALLELSKYTNAAKTAEYHDFAISTLKQLSSRKYQSRNNNDAFLLHSTGHKPNGSEVNASIIYADYYYLEALQRLAK